MLFVVPYSSYIFNLPDAKNGQFCLQQFLQQLYSKTDEAGEQMEEEFEIRSATVPCLKGTTELEKECFRQKIKISSSARNYLLRQMLRALAASQSQKLILQLVNKGIINWDDEETFEVEQILDHCEDDETGETYYLIKWIGWASIHNSWEPKHNLECPKVISDYHSSISSRKRKISMILPKESRKEQTKDLLFRKLSASEAFANMSFAELVECFSPLKKKAETSGFRRRHVFREKSRQSSGSVVLKGKTLRVKKAEVQEALKEWEDRLNNIVSGYDYASISVVNDVDLEGPPDNFVYINECKEGPGVTIIKDPLVGCDCVDCFENHKSCCAASSGYELAYYKSGRLKVPKGTPIYECNDRCKCGPDCLNRVVQKGRKFRICIFRTANGRGWGVMARQLIKKGSFVMEYVGEVITNDEADRRGKEYDAVGRTYLFDLDFDDPDAQYTIDAGVYGNAAHFINHSCDPNLEVYAVWINSLDALMPRLCLFAKRDIKRNEELTFDYISGAHQGETSMQLSKDRNDTFQDGDSDVFRIPEANSELSLEMESSEICPIKSVPPSPPLTDKDSVRSNKNVSHYRMVCQCGSANCRKIVFC